MWGDRAEGEVRGEREIFGGFWTGGEWGGGYRKREVRNSMGVSSPYQRGKNIYANHAASRMSKSEF